MSSSLRRRGTINTSNGEDDEKRSDIRTPSDLLQTPITNQEPSQSQQQRIRGSYLKNLFFNNSSSQKKNRITPENIYATANIGAFAALLSLVALVVGIITLMLTHERSLFQTMKTSYQFMKELSTGYHSGIAEIKRKHGEARMPEALSEFVQTMHALPWRTLRENIDQTQLEELFKVLAEIPQGIDQVQDMAWSICVALRRIFGLTTDYCIPSQRHPPSKVIIYIKDIDKFNYLNTNHDEMMTINFLIGEYLEKGLSECVENWHKQRRNQVINLLPTNGNDEERSDAAENYYQSLESMITIRPRVFEKLIIHPQNQQDIFSLLYGTNLMLINRFVLHNDPDWHIDYVQISNRHTFAMNSIIYNPMQLTYSKPGINVFVQTIKIRFPLFDGYSEFHTFKADMDPYSTDGLNNIRQITYNYAESQFIQQSSQYFKRVQAKRKKIVMNRELGRWEVYIQNNKAKDDRYDFVFKASMNKPLHKKTSWEFVDQTPSQEAPPIIFFDKIIITNPIESQSASNEKISGLYQWTDNPFDFKYFAQYDPHANLIFVKKSNGTIYRLFKAKEPDHQWYIQSFSSQPISKHKCRLSLKKPGDNQSSLKYDLCTHVVPFTKWKAIKPHPSIKALSIEFSYNKDRIFSIYLIYNRYLINDSLSSENSLSLLKEITIKGGDIYFKIFTQRDIHDLDMYYNRVVLDMTTFNPLKNLIDFCSPKQGQDNQTSLPTLHLRDYKGNVEAIGGTINGTFIIVFYNVDDCRNLQYTIRLYSKAVSFK